MIVWYGWIFVKLMNQNCWRVSNKEWDAKKLLSNDLIEFHWKEMLKVCCGGMYVWSDGQTLKLFPIRKSHSRVIVWIEKEVYQDVGNNAWVVHSWKGNQKVQGTRVRVTCQVTILYSKVQWKNYWKKLDDKRTMRKYSQRTAPTNSRLMVYLCNVNRWHGGCQKNKPL